MTPDEREQYYDREIAPQLVDLCQRCCASGISFLAAAEWRPGAIGRTIHFTEPHGEGISQANDAICANGDIDAMIRSWIEAAQQNGHSSAYLYRLGVPFDPSQE